MTITAGNSNNGIPMGGYVPGTGSGGGGGVSGDVYRYKGSVPTYTALPAENLEIGDVYNVIDTDMNYAWTGTAWDPLGSTVDLSPYYTGAQVDVKLAKKQDKLTPNAPLKISSYAKVYGFVGMVSDGVGGFYTDKPNEYYYHTNSATWEVRFEWNSTGATETTKSHYIDLPFEIGKIYKVPGMKGVNGSFINGVIVGYTPEDNTTFHPSFKVGLSDSSINLVGSTSITPAIKSEGNYYTYYTRATGVQSTNYNGGTDERMWWSTKDAIEAMPSPENIDPTVAYFQILDEGTYLQMNVLGARYDDGEWLYQRKSFGASHSLMLTKVRQMNTVRIYAALGMYSSGYGSSAANPMLSSQLGIYPTENSLLTMTSEELLALPNEFVIGNESIKTYLDLDIGAGLAVSDNVLINSNPTPYELPTASTETLGGVKVDGTSIVIADGVISTNTGTGVDTYTKAEVNNLLSAKQDTITPSSPLSITKEVRSNLEGFQYTTDSTGVYVEGNSYWSIGGIYSYYYVNINGQNTPLPGTTLNSETFANKIVIPYSLGQVVKVPTTYTAVGQKFAADTYRFGKLLEDGTFVPIVNIHTNVGYIIDSDVPTTYGGIYGNSMVLSYVDVGQQFTNSNIIVSSSTPANPTGILVQLFEDTDGSIWCNTNNTLLYYGSLGRVEKAQKHYTDTSYINRLKEINCCVILPVANGGNTVDYPLPVSNIGLYSNPGNLYNLINSENYNNIDLGENLFDLSGEQAYNYLDLSIDNSTIKVNDSGQLYAVPQSSIDPDSYYDKNEVDTLLEDKAEKVDLDKKENKITTTGALSLTEKVMSNLNGMSITDDGLGAFSTAGSYLTYAVESWSDADNSSVLGSIGNTYFTAGEYTADSWRGGFIDMPYTFGYTIKAPSNVIGYCGYAGKYDAEGRFIPIISLNYSHNSKNIVYSNSFTLESPSSNYTVLKGQATAAEGKSPYVSTSGGRRNSAWTLEGKTYDYLQWVIESDGFITQIYRDAPTTDTRFYVATSTSASVESIARWKEVSVIRFVPKIIGTSANNIVGNASNPFSIVDFGLYPTDKKIYEYASENDLIATGNLFDLSGQTIQNYLELNLGSGLSVEDNKLVCTASIPDNITTQGNTFNGANQLVQLDSTGKLPAVDGSQLTNLPGGSYTLPAATTSALGGVKPDGITITVDEDGTIHSTQEGFADLAANNVFTGTNQFQSTVTVGNGFNTAVLNMGPGSGLIFENSSQAGGKKLSLGTQTGTQVTIYSDGVPIIQRSEIRTNQSSSEDNPYTKYNNVDSGNINDILGISFWKGTQTEYDGITEKDANTLYIITG